MNIEKQIFEISEYFKKKVIEGDYEIKSHEFYRSQVLVDKKYAFSLLVQDNKVDFLFIDSDLLKLEIKKDEDKKQAFEKLKPKLEEFKKTTLKAQKKAELERLQKEYNEL